MPSNHILNFLCKSAVIKFSWAASWCWAASPTEQREHRPCEEEGNRIIEWFWLHQCGREWCSHSALKLVSWIAQLCCFCTWAVPIKAVLSVSALCSIYIFYIPVFPGQNTDEISHLRTVLVLARGEHARQLTESRTSRWYCWKGKRWENVAASGVYWELNVLLEVPQVAARCTSSVSFKVLDIATSILFS